MDMSFANQALAVEHLVRTAASSAPACIRCRGDRREVARLKLDSLGVEIDELTPEQQEYLSSWATGLRS